VNFQLLTWCVVLIERVFFIPRIVESTFQGVLYLQNAWMDLQSNGGCTTFTLRGNRMQCVAWVRDGFHGERLVT